MCCQSVFTTTATTKPNCHCRLHLRSVLSESVIVMATGDSPPTAMVHQCAINRGDQYLHYRNQMAIIVFTIDQFQVKVSLPLPPAIHHQLSWPTNLLSSPAIG